MTNLSTENLLRCLLFTVLLLPALAATAAKPDAKPAAKTPARRSEHTSFQSGRAWNPVWDIQTDVAMVYGIDPKLPDRLKTWKDRGYIPQVMTGVSWGEYQDYLYGRFDGKNHEDAAQERKDGSKVSHGGDVYYMVPEEPFGRFLTVGVKRAIDAGAEAIYMEEPEFWTFGGYAPAFKREWKAYYGEDWQDPESSPEARYRANKLMYYLYKRALAQVFTFIKDYSRQIGRTVRCYVPTHSMLNYASWNIVSPESSLATLPGCDGYIAQVWTGTARTPNWYNGLKRERTFETAFLEYGQMHNLTRATGRRMIFLADPIEDWPDHSWADYKTNYEQTLVASLLWPDVTHFEVVPWPERVFQGQYPKVDMKQRKPGEPVEKEPIPPAYATQLMTCFEALKRMDQKDVEWHAAAHGVGVLVSDTLMFHRGGPNDPGGDLSHIYGQMLPLLKRGIAVEPVQLENVHLKDYLKPYKVLFLSYVGQKPMDAKPHEALVKWVKAGGTLVLLDGPDEFNNIREWWNTGRNAYQTPMAHLLTQFQPSGWPDADRHWAIGKGHVLHAIANPRDDAEQASGAGRLMKMLDEEFRRANFPVKSSNALWLRRGPYVTGAVMEESVSDKPLTLKGRFVDLFQADLPVLVNPTFRPGSRFLLVDLAHVPAGQRVIANASALRDVRNTKTGMTFKAVGPVNVGSSIRLRLPGSPTRVAAKGADGQPLDIQQTWDAATSTALLRFTNSPEGVNVSIGWAAK